MVCLNTLRAAWAVGVFGRLSQTWSGVGPVDKASSGVQTYKPAGYPMAWGA